MDKNSIGMRMKAFYEAPAQSQLMRREPVIIRIDGKAFHTFTRDLKRPFDEVLVTAMQDTLAYLCEHIQGCQLGYCQSDEISLLLVDYKNLNSQGWFDYNVQKMSSIAASMATLEFNRAFARNAKRKLFTINNLPSCTMEESEYADALEKCLIKGAMFDARCFNIPKEEVTNYFLWRQLDAERNSTQMVARVYFSHKELQNKSCGMINHMLRENGIFLHRMAPHLLRGTTCRRIEEFNGITYKQRNRWIIDLNMPRLVEDREYIDQYVYCANE